MKQIRHRRLNTCPIDSCTYESHTFIDLLRHMVESERHLVTGHQEWLADALGVEFAQYAFKKDRRVADLFAEYFRRTGKNLPNDPVVFNAWFMGYRKRFKM